MDRHTGPAFAAGVRACSVPRHLRPRRRRAVRLRRWHQPAVDRLGAGPSPGRPRPRLQQHLGAGRVRARLPQRVREVHRPPARGADAASALLPDALDDAGQEGRRPKRHLPRVPAARPGRAPLLAVRRTAPPAATRPRPTSSQRHWSGAHAAGDPLVPVTADTVDGTTTRGGRAERLHVRQRSPGRRLPARLTRAAIESAQQRLPGASVRIAPRCWPRWAPRRPDFATT